MRWYHYLCNVDVIVAIIFIGIILYFILSERKKKQKYEFKGLSDDKWNAKHSAAASLGEEYRPIFVKKDKKPQKRVNKHEERCREIFEGIFKKEFKSVRPKWLKNPATGRNLELDGYNADVQTPLGEGLAFEYDGVQHAKFGHFHGSPEDFEYQVKKDTYKDMLCKEHNIMLIRIPHFVHYNDLERYIVDKLKRMKVYPGPSAMSFGYKPPRARGMYG